MATITVTNQKFGGDTGRLATEGKPITIVVDIAKAVADSPTYAANDTLQIEAITLPVGTRLLGFDAEIVEALDSSTTTNIGHTAADPDEYVDGQTAVAVGRFGAYVSATFPEIITTTAKDIIVQVARTGTFTKGKIAIKIVADSPLNLAPELAAYRNDYTHS